MIKADYIGKTITVNRQGSKRKIDIHKGMPKQDIEYLKECGIDILEPKKKPNKKKVEDYKGIDKESDKNQEDEK